MLDSLPIGLWFAWVLAVLWIFVAIGLWVTGARVADVSLKSPDRSAAVARFRLLHLVSLLLLLSLSGWLVVAVWLWDWWPMSISASTAVLLLTLLASVAVIAIATTRYRALPGRRWLRLIENAGILSLCIGLAVYAVVGMRTVMVPSGLWRYAASAALALALGFFLLSRAPARAALLLARHLASHGSQPRFEGTLKRLLRRHRPILIASALAVMLGMGFSWRAVHAGEGGGQLAGPATAHPVAAT